jgi:guanylate kinase
LTERRKRQGWRFSISYTTRARRQGERNGREYVFVSEDEFDRKARDNFFAEHFKVHLARYGTPRGPLEAVRTDGGVMILDVDVNGAKALRKEYPDAVTIFVLPPSQNALRRRLSQRGTETKVQLELRFQNALEEMSTFRSFGFDYIVVNRDIDEAVADVEAIIRAETCRVKNVTQEQLDRIIR